MDNNIIDCAVLNIFPDLIISFVCASLIGVLCVINVDRVANKLCPCCQDTPSTYFFPVLSLVHIPIFAFYNFIFIPQSSWAESRGYIIGIFCLLNLQQIINNCPLLINVSFKINFELCSSAAFVDWCCFQYVIVCL